MEGGGKAQRGGSTSGEFVTNHHLTPIACISISREAQNPSEATLTL